MKYFALTTSGSSPGSTQAAKQINLLLIYMHYTNYNTINHNLFTIYMNEEKSDVLSCKSSKTSVT